MDTIIARQTEAHMPSLRRYARLLVQDLDLADDVVQDCLERAVPRLHLYRETGSLRGWLCTILLNVVRSRKAQRHRWEPIDVDALRLRDLRRAFAGLPDSFQEVIVLVAIEGMTYEEAARVLEVPVGTVRSRLARARRQLEAVMDGTEPAAPHDAATPCLTTG